MKGTQTNMHHIYIESYLATLQTLKAHITKEEHVITVEKYYVYMYVCTKVCMCMYVCMSMYEYVRVCMCMYVYVCACACMHVYVYVCVCMCM